MKLRNKKTGKVTSDYSYILLESTHYKTYNSLAELNEEWEDYKPKKPLITHEKVRKAVRAWAEANDFTKLKFAKWGDNHWILRAENEDGHEFDIDFFDINCKKRPKYEDATFYTIDELCGKEEE